MTNLPANRQTNQMTTQGPDYDPYTAFADANSPRSIVGTLLKFSKGDYRHGDAGTIMPIGTRLVTDPAEIMVGMIKWGQGRPSEQIMGRIGSGFIPPRRDELGDNNKDLWAEFDEKGQPRDPWQRGMYMLLMTEKGSDIYTFASGSKGGNDAVPDMCRAYGKIYRSRGAQLPIIELQVESYKHKVYSWIKKPKFNIVGWMPRETFDQAANAELAGDQGGDETQGNLDVANDNVKVANDNKKAATPKDDRRPQF